MKFRLRRRLSTDYGFDVSMKYEDKDGDMIILASQNDLDDIFMSDEAETINVMISETLSLPNLHLKGPMATARLGTAPANPVVSLYNTSSVLNSAVLSNPTGLLSTTSWSKPSHQTEMPSMTSGFTNAMPNASHSTHNVHSTTSSLANNTNNTNATNTNTHNNSSLTRTQLLRPVPTTRMDRFPSISGPDNNTSGGRTQEIFNIRWKKGEMLGQGAFGVVYLGLNIDSGMYLLRFC